jgi:hypothetical protein
MKYSVKSVCQDTLTTILEELDIQITPNKYMKKMGCTVLKTPSFQFPDMVMVTKSPNQLKHLVGKKFINLKKCLLSIEEGWVEDMINSTKPSYKQLSNSVVLKQY